ncbi:unnamed protein product [Clonostachys chloroleuca]|uniref:Uncharacterized protein n=1 Tax=Clonostachys chloroleuca TaxID=1926264 RepID=A0AA35VBI8_9HYPO|nr:unnamed protein product [Clonostachys chloroleuca]
MPPTNELALGPPKIPQITILGCVLIIEDAHMLYRSDSSRQDNEGIIDSLVANIGPDHDRCVLLCRYSERMKTLFLNCNPGLR